MNIGIITYKNYDENVLLNAHFNIDELFKIILFDKDFVKFEIFDTNKKLLASTYYPQIEGKGFFIDPVKVEREEEIKWIDYYAFRSPSTIRHTKVTWKVKGEVFRTKKKADECAKVWNKRASYFIEHLIDRSTYSKKYK
ncbi:hypothetical protein [Chryseobacterium defluvii]|uniref:Uncharacterized protein n=1 Tax=Chryseobacterium defluvii TaxID=160396 RepID=A0A495SNE8_9FLAO|nr:hypothetical protein [Chryseobacterium defluvii]RKT01763.1 hypothetical protein BCF58_0987 [Chryseobacterium defluvii]